MTGLRSKADFPQANAFGIVSHDEAMLQIVPVVTRHATLYLYVEKIQFSVYKPAIGGFGILTIQTNDGDEVWAINTDEVGKSEVDWGELGAKISDTENIGLQAVLSGADTQASVAVGITCHYVRK